MRTAKKIWILSGEASGDVYGAKLARELRLIAAERGETIEIVGMGGPEMRKADIDIRVDSTELGVVGVIEVLKHIFTFIGIFFRLVGQAKRERPGAVVLIDYPGFNLLFALNDLGLTTAQFGRVGAVGGIVGVLRDWPNIEHRLSPNDLTNPDIATVAANLRTALDSSEQRRPVQSLR